MCAERRLPSWMRRCDPAGRRDEPLRRTAQKRERQQRPDRILLYWMNEGELLETARDALKEVKADGPAVATEVNVIPETDSEEEPHSDDQGRTSGSNSDVDIAEQETVPYTTCMEKERLSRGSDSSGDRQRTDSHASGKEAEVEGNWQRTKPDTEALQLVREIFFS